MRKVIIFGMMCLMALSIQAQNVGDGNTFLERATGNRLVDTLSAVPAGYVDLGLPSGTLWKDKNEDGYFNYNEAVGRFGSKLPSKQKFEELKSECKWEWNGSSYKVIGPNGNSIKLPASGYRSCSGSVYRVGSYGHYWFSTPEDSDYAWNLNFNSGGVSMDSNNRCYGLSVRLVQD